MFKYIVRRLILSIPVLLGVSFLSFIIIQAAPGDFLDQFRMNPTFSQESIRLLEEKFGLNDNFFVQYGKWLFQMVQGNWGHSFQYHQPVFSIIWTRVGATLLLSITTLILSWSIGISVGIFAALRQYRPGDQIASVVAFLGLSIPNFFFALLFLYFAAKTGWFPIGGIMSINSAEFGFWQTIGDYLWHVVGPAITLGFSGLAGVMRQMRGQFLDQMSMDYVEFARAKGMPRRTVVFGHALRNAINPLITMFGYALSSLLGGAVLTETVFSWPGMGRLTIEALNAQDLYLVMATLLLSSLMLIIGNLIADIFLAGVDPRVRKRFQ
ncbi:MAG TPA: ABC transporter permease [Thermotogota bacterium]|nr:ABC transporter permease [Thermotogota bacterium]HRW92676.1 ABC transporter permease [Thermotogota bacterium]